MKFALFTAAILAIASAPAYSGLTILFEDNGTLVSALAPGAAPLFEQPTNAATVIALAD